MYRILVVSHPIKKYSKQEVDPYCKLSKAGFKIFFLYGGGISPNDLMYNCGDNNGNVVFIRCKRNPIYMLKMILHIVKVENIDFLMNSTSSIKNMLYITIIKKLSSKIISIVRIEANTPKVAALQGKGVLLKFFKRILYPAVWRLSISNAHGIISLSTYLSKLSLTYGGKKIITVSQGVDTNLFKPTKMKKEFDLIFVGRLSKEKNLPMLLEVVERIKKEIPSIRLCIIGDGPEKRYLEKKYKSRNICFKGHMDHSLLPEYYNKAKILVLVSVSEGLPTVIMEAMACGLPVIATNVGGVSELIDNGVTGYLIKPKDELELEEKIKLMLMNENIRLKMGLKARQFIVKRHSIEAISKIYKKFLEELKNESKNICNY